MTDWIRHHLSSEESQMACDRYADTILADSFLLSEFMKNYDISQNGIDRYQDEVDRMEETEADEPEEYGPEPVLAEQRSAQPAEKFSLEQLLMDDEGAVNPVKRSEPQERPDEQPELTPEQAEQRKQRVLTAVFAVVIVAASLVFAAFGVQHVEVLLALCFCMYLGMRYRLAAFGFAVLAVRRLYDAIVLLMQGGHLLEALTDGCICVIFITLTLHMLRTYANSKNQADADETE